MSKSFEISGSRVVIPPEDETLENMVLLIKSTSKIKEYIKETPIANNNNNNKKHMVHDLKTMRKDHITDEELHETYENARAFRWTEFGYKLALDYANRKDDNDYDS